MCDKSTEPIELLCEAVRGSVPRGPGGTKTEGSANTGLFMKCSSSLAHVWCCRANASGDPRTGPPGYLEHTCSARTCCCSLTLLDVRTNKEFKRFILSLADICWSLQSQNWFNRAAECAWQAQAGQRQKDTGAHVLGTWSHSRC